MASAALGDEGRGRSAVRPRDVPSRGWWEVAKRVGRRLSHDRISIIAAGVAFYALFAVFPGLAALVSIYGLLFDPQQVAEQIQSLGAVLPPEAADILVQQLGDVSSSGRQSLGLAAAGGILVALWSASKGVKTLMVALNVAYHEEEKRGFFKLNALALLLTLGAIVSAIVAIALIVALPAIIAFLGLGRVAEVLIALGHLVLLGALMIFGMAVVFRFGPSREKPQWRWVTPGAALGTVLWIAGSALFAVYVRNFASYNETYGTMGAVVILLTWFLLTAYAILIGAELNAEMERQTAKDTSESGGRPLGQRGAYAADTVAR